jgi:predicted transcriptional regulator
MAFIGWFLLDAARSSYVQVELMAGLRDRRVADIMDRDYVTVEGHLSLQDFVDKYVLRTGRRCFVVVQNDRISGLITTHEVKTIARDSWAQTSVQSVMRPLAQLRTVAPDTPAIQAFELMSREDINQLPVISDGHVQGVFSRGQVLRFLRTQAELHRN